MEAKIYATWADMFQDYGRQLGLAEGERRVLKRIVCKRFGAIPDKAALQIDRVLECDIDQWIDRALEANTLQEWLGEAAAPGS